MVAIKINHIVSGVLDRMVIIYIILSGLTLGMIILKLPFLAIFMVLGLIITIAFAKKPLGALAVLILILPFAKAIFLKDPVMMKGTEPIHLIAIMVIFFALINIKNSVVMPRYAAIFITVVLIVFTIAALRSINYLDLINFRNIMDDREALSTSAHILKTLVRPLFCFFPLIVILKYVRNDNDLNFIIKIITLTILFYSICILSIYSFLVPSKSVAESTQSYHAYLGLQRNVLADYLILGLPFFIANFFLHKNIFNILTIFLCIMAVGFTFTRTAYVTTILTFIIYLIISKRAKFLPMLIAISFCLAFFVSSIIIERASKGLYSMDRNEISAGRIDNQWIPLIEEYLNDPFKLLFGNGRFSIVSSKQVTQGLMPDSMMHPHNMYLEQIIDAGIVSFILIISLFAFLMLKILKSLKFIENRMIREYQYAVFVSLTSFFIAGMTGRTLFPSERNGLLWIIFGLGIVIVHMTSKIEEDKNIYLYESTYFTS
jgi:O-Antigen ligase